MNLSFMLLEQILIMGVLILIGYASIRLHILKTEDSASISTLVLFIISPCLILNSFQIDFSREKMLGFLLALVASVLMHLLFLLVNRLLAGCFHLNQVEQASVIYSNCGNLIVPLIGAILGDEYVLYCCAFMSVQTVLLWTQGIRMLGDRGPVNLRKIFLNPNILAMVAGLFLFFTGLRLPKILGTAVERTGDCIAPISMFVIGILIASKDLKEVFTRGRSWLVCFFRLLVLPLLTIGLLYVSGLWRLYPDAASVLFVSFLAAAAPTAVNVTQISNIYGQDSVLAGSINVMSVILCIITMPLMTAVYQWVFL